MKRWEWANGLFNFEGLFYFLFLDPRQLDEKNNKKNENLVYFIGRRWETVNRIEIAELLEFIFFFFTRKNLLLQIFS